MPAHDGLADEPRPWVIIEFLFKHIFELNSFLVHCDQVVHCISFRPHLCYNQVILILKYDKYSSAHYQFYLPVLLKLFALWTYSWTAPIASFGTDPSSTSSLGALPSSSRRLSPSQAKTPSSSHHPPKISQPRGPVLLPKSSHSTAQCTPENQTLKNINPLAKLTWRQYQNCWKWRRTGTTRNKNSLKKETPRSSLRRGLNCPVWWRETPISQPSTTSTCPSTI